ncbi:MAG: serine hydroxymethyltransferase, partial [Patescibacteria group bacterium]|nr:serine hydroxymethyltransferase [Patescibacteria group bacterium]
MDCLENTDPKISSLLKKEIERQAKTLMMIPSENMVSEAVEEVVGSCLGNKYAEGYPNKRYYQGQEFIDQIENLTIKRVKKAFKVAHANVQALSGSPANLAVYKALLNSGDKLMGLALDHGGHLTHGSKVSASGQYYESVPYTLNKDEKMDYRQIRELALKEKPQIIVAGITAYPLQVDWSEFGKIADEVGAYLLADISHISGLVVAGEYPSPSEYVDVITSTTHKTLRGARGALVMVTNKGMKKDENMGKKIDKAVFPGLQGGPHMNSIAGIAVALKEAETSGFKFYAKQIVKNAKKLAETLKSRGLRLVSGGTETHMMLVDLRNKNITGNLAAEALEKANIVLNRNGIPFDPNPPFYPSGIRLGTPGLTSREMKEKEMEEIGNFIVDIIDDISKIK